MFVNRNRPTTASPFALLHYEPFCYSDSGAVSGGSASPAPNGGVSNGAGGANGATPNGATADTSTTPQTIGFDFNAAMERLGETLAPRLDALRQDVNNLPEHLRPPPQEPPAPDYDTMTQSELVAHLNSSVTQMVQKAITEALTPLTQQITNVQQTYTTDKVTGEVNQMKSTLKDFTDWKDEMVGLARQHPTLGVKELYALARSLNTDKAKQLDTKYNPPAPPPPPRWGGLTPSAPGATGSTPPLSRADAGREAYREVAARHPGILSALESL